jgi:hypothetical protein
MFKIRKISKNLYKNPDTSVIFLNRKKSGKKCAKRRISRFLPDVYEEHGRWGKKSRI